MRGAVQMQSARNGGDGKDDFETPPEVMERVRLVVPGCRLLDPCTSVRNPTGAWVGFVLEQGRDGLNEPWCVASNDTDECNLVYVNPPFSQVRRWAEKVAGCAMDGLPIVTLVAGRTGTRWYRQLLAVADAVAFWPGRVRFNADGAPAMAWSKKLGQYVAASATFETHLLGINVSQRRFRRAFDNCQVVLP
jgi:hypothetical protein